MKNSQFLNLGCGEKFHKDWINIDKNSNSKNVINYNLIKGIPYPDNYFDFVYHSHVLEHFTKIDGEKFINECFRVLKPKGTIRIVVPNLELLVKNYLLYFEETEKGVKGAEVNYEWALLELFDQIARNTSGGEMIKFLKMNQLANNDFIKNRLGKSFKVLSASSNTLVKRKHLTILKKIALFPSIKQFIKNTNFYTIYNIGKFRLSGEVHYWMYDKVSLKILLEKIGFKNIETKTALTSNLENWKDYSLDDPTEKASIFIEAIK